MYSLLARIPDGLNPLRSRFELHVKKAGLSAIEKIAEQEGETVVSCVNAKLQTVANFRIIISIPPLYRNPKHMLMPF